MSTLLKWAQNTTQGKNNKNNNGSPAERKWIHPPEALQKGHIAYLVKFLGNTIVDQPKGIEVVKEAIRKLQFSQQLRKSETGGKTRKVELTVSADGVAIQEPRTHNILHQFPLHRISYCADDKGEKKYFSFIVKQQTPDSEQEEKHECFVFISDKLAEEITLTIGQAFELAYKRFLETSGKDLESHRRMMVTQQKLKRLEQENNIYKQRLLEVSRFNTIKHELDQYLRKHDIKNLIEIRASSNNSTGSDISSVNSESLNGNGTIQLLDISSENTNGNVPPVPPRQFPSVGTKLEGLLLNEFEQDDDDFDPRSFENNHTPIQSPNITNGNSFSAPPLLAPPPKAVRRANVNNNNSENLSRTFGQDLFGITPFGTQPTVISPVTNNKVSDPFEMGDFGSSITGSKDIEKDIGILDKRLLEMKTGFSRGISFGNEDFSLESLDPLKN